MRPDLEALARRAVACKGWRWMAGMLVSGMRIDGESDGRPVRITTYSDEWGEQVRMHGFVHEGLEFPALHDPATLGCLLALVREAWGEPNLGAYYSASLEGWICAGCRHNGSWCRPRKFRVYPTEAAALVVALEAAP